MHGRSQAVRLPKEFRLPGKEVRVSRDGDRIILEPVNSDPAKWLQRVRRNAAEADRPFMPDGRQQPVMPDGSDIDLDER